MQLCFLKPHVCSDGFVLWYENSHIALFIDLFLSIINNISHNKVWLYSSREIKCDIKYKQMNHQMKKLGLIHFFEVLELCTSSESKN